MAIAKNRVRDAGTVGWRYIVAETHARIPGACTVWIIWVITITTNRRSVGIHVAGKYELMIWQRPVDIVQSTRPTRRSPIEIPIGAGPILSGIAIQNHVRGCHYGRCRKRFGWSLSLERRIGAGIAQYHKWIIRVVQVPRRVIRHQRTGR